MTSRRTPAWDLTTLFLGGLPENKLEVIEGKVPCAVPFPSEEAAQETARRWIEAVARWKGAEDVLHSDAAGLEGEVAGYEFRVRGRRLDVRIPISIESLGEIWAGSWDPSAWPDSGRGRLAPWDLDRVSIALFSALGRTRTEHDLCVRCDLVLTPTTIVEPTLATFRSGTAAWIGPPRKGYPCGVPELVAEVLSPATREADLPSDGRRAGLLAAAGVRHYWLADAGARSLAVYRGESGRFRLSEVLGPGDTFRPEFPDGVSIRISELFEGGGESRAALRESAGGPARMPGPVPDEEPASLEHLLLAGHPRKRYEVLDDVAPCVVALDDGPRARRHYERWCREAARLEGAPEATPGGDTFEVGRFLFRLEGRRVHLDLRTPASAHLELLACAADPTAWRER